MRHTICILVYLFVICISSATSQSLRRLLDDDFDDDDAKRFLSVRAAEELHLSIQEGLIRPLFGDSWGLSSQLSEEQEPKLFATYDDESPIKTEVSATDHEEQLRQLDFIKESNAQVHKSLTNKRNPRRPRLRVEPAITSVAKQNQNLAPRAEIPPPPKVIDPVQAALDEQALRIGQKAKDASHVTAQVARSIALQMPQGQGETSGPPVLYDNERSKKALIDNPRTAQLKQSLKNSAHATNELVQGDLPSQFRKDAAAFLLALERERMQMHPLNNDSTMRLLQDSHPLEEDDDAYDIPELYQQERPGSAPLTIWTPDDPLPRDILNTKPAEVWLYSLLAADYGGTQILPHFLEHYSRLGIPIERMLFLVNYNTAKKREEVEAVSPLDDMLALLDTWGVDYRVWLGQYSAEAHLKLKLEILERVPIRDWIVMADSDEFHDYGGMTAPQFLEKCTNQGANWVKGFFLDRVSENGRLDEILPDPPIWLQFPLKCDVARRLAHGDPTKIAAFRGYWRSGVGNHGIIPPDVAQHYFGPTEPGEESPRYGLCGAEDLYPLTPYHKYNLFYRSENVTGNAYLWTLMEAEFKVKVHHFKWHAGVEESVKDRLKHYKGDDEPCGQKPGQPRFKFWKESDRLLREVIEKGGVDTTNPFLKCKVSENPARIPLNVEATHNLLRVRDLHFQQRANLE